MKVLQFNVNVPKFAAAKTLRTFLIFKAALVTTFSP